VASLAASNLAERNKTERATKFQKGFNDLIHSFLRLIAKDAKGCVNFFFGEFGQKNRPSDRFISKQNFAPMYVGSFNPVYVVSKLRTYMGMKVPIYLCTWV
jgi:hypothetical protein